MLHRLPERIGRKRKKLAKVARCYALGQIQSESELRQDRSHVDEALAGFGLVAEFVPERAETLYLWPDNLRSWNLFQALGTQWSMGFAGAVGLNYAGVEVVMRNWRIKRRDEQQVFREIQAMERATLAAWREKDDG